MPRRRTNDGLPKYCRRRSYGVIYSPYIGRENGKSKWGKDVNLGPSNMAVADVWLAFKRETSEESDTLRWLLSAYVDSKHVKGKAKRTRDDYASYRDILNAFPMANGKPFGSARLVDIKRTAIKKFLDKYHAPISANRLIQFMKAAWNWALDRHDHVPENPCMGVKLNTQTERKRYVKPEEYQAIHPLTTGWVHWAMELAYLLRARRSEIITMRVNAITEEGLDWDRGKGSDGEITLWTPRLRAAIEGALKHSYGNAKPIGNARILLNNYGSPVTASAWNSALQRLRPKMKEKGIAPFTLHDLKAAGYSDQETQYAGHRSPKMHNTYNRKKRIVEPAE